MTRFTLVHEPLPSLRVFERRRMGDDRGFLERLYDADEADDVMGFAAIGQVNRTWTADVGTVRGMHFQREPMAEIKLVHCVRGAVFDVAVDVRAGSPTFLHWHGEILSETNGRCMRIPEGFAHGFQTLEPDSELLYVHSKPYRPDREDGLHPLDPRLAISWPGEVGLMSGRDGSWPWVDASFVGIIS